MSLTANLSTLVNELCGQTRIQASQTEPRAITAGFLPHRSRSSFRASVPPEPSSRFQRLSPHILLSTFARQVVSKRRNHA